jgi:hypothetical protein
MSTYNHDIGDSDTALLLYDPPLTRLSAWLGMPFDHVNLFHDRPLALWLEFQHPTRFIDFPASDDHDDVILSDLGPLFCHFALPQAT